MAVVRKYTVAFAGTWASGTRVFSVSDSGGTNLLWKVKSSDVQHLEFKYFPKWTDADDAGSVVPQPQTFRVGSNDNYTVDHICEAVFTMADGSEKKIELQHINTSPTDFTAGNEAAMQAFRDAWFT